MIRSFGTAEHDPEVHKKIHFDLIHELNIVNLESACKVSGSRAYYLINEGVLLNQALINFALQFARERNYQLVHTPFFMTKEVMAECAQLEQFDEELYKVPLQSSSDFAFFGRQVSGEGDDKYLIATSEQTLCAMHRKKWFEPEELPIRQCGYSTCFRKEAGSRGRDTLGIFRVHQFEKVEQFVVCSPDDQISWEILEEMLKNAEDFYQTLKIPYRVVTIVSGDLNNAAAKKYDLEAWFPASRTFRELVSCSNCTDYQARRLDARLRTPKQEGLAQEKKYVHMLNSTITATERTICCILENYQTAGGVVVPQVLRPFMGGMEFIPFVKQNTAPPN